MIISPETAQTLMKAAQLNLEQITSIGDHVTESWRTIVPALQEYIDIPNVSRQFNPDWATDGHTQKVIRLVTAWIQAQDLQGATWSVNKIDGHAPVIFLEVPATPGASDKNVLLYGHLDKQPGMAEKWRHGLGPWTPVIEGDRLYGRGSADDGYAVFASVAAIKALQKSGIPHSKMTVLIEFSEESGSPGLEEHVISLQEKIGQPDLVICLDSGTCDYNRIWITTSLRVFWDREATHMGPMSFCIFPTLND